MIETYRSRTEIYQIVNKTNGARLRRQESESFPRVKAIKGISDDMN
jgi:hypothetical protein